MKETTVINHLDKSILAVNRRHAKKFSSAYEGADAQGQGQGQQGQGSERGYESFKELVRDVEGLVDVIWVSGTRMFSIHIQYSVYTIQSALHIQSKEVTNNLHYSIPPNPIHDLPSCPGELESI